MCMKEVGSGALGTLWCLLLVTALLTLTAVSGTTTDVSSVPTETSVGTTIITDASTFPTETSLGSTITTTVDTTEITSTTPSSSDSTTTTTTTTTTHDSTTLLDTTTVKYTTISDSTTTPDTSTIPDSTTAPESTTTLDSTTPQDSTTKITTQEITSTPEISTITQDSTTALETTTNSYSTTLQDTQTTTQERTTTPDTTQGTTIPSSTSTLESTTTTTPDSTTTQDSTTPGTISTLASTTTSASTTSHDTITTTSDYTTTPPTTLDTTTPITTTSDTTFSQTTPETTTTQTTIEYTSPTTQDITTTVDTSSPESTTSDSTTVPTISSTNPSTDITTDSSASTYITSINTTPYTTMDTTVTDTTTIDTTKMDTTADTSTVVTTNMVTISTALTTVPTTLPPQPPPNLTFQSISMVVTLNVRETQNKVLDVIVCNERSNNPVKVSLQSVSPRNGQCSKCFQILPSNQNGQHVDWYLRFLPTAGQLDITNVPVYTLNITCENSNHELISWITEVRLTVNSPPVFNHSGMYDFTTVQNTKDQKTGYVIYNASASDVDNDGLLYTMTVSPDNGNFKIGEADGVIRATRDLSGECSPAVTFKIFVSDQVNSPVGPFMVSSTLDGSNQAPQIQNMDELIQLPENKPTNIIFYQIQILDDRGDVHNISWTVNPSQARVFLDILANKGVVLTRPLDFEQPVGGTNRLSLRAQARDGGGCVSQWRTLDIEVTDVNEPPQILPPSWTVSVYEGVISIDPGWTVKDPDFNDAAYFSFTRTSNIFTIDSNTGTVSSIGEYDYENSKKTPETLIVKVTDRGGLTATATLTIIIVDSNDNPPIVKSFPAPVEAQECWPVGKLLVTLSATDADSSYQGNNVTYFESLTSTFFSVLPSGQVYLTSQIAVGQFSTATVYAWDQVSQNSHDAVKSYFVYSLSSLTWPQLNQWTLSYN